MKKAKTGMRSEGNGNGNAVLKRVTSPLPVITTTLSPRHFQTATAASAHVTERYNMNLTLLRTPKTDTPASPALQNPTPKISSTSDVRDLVSTRLESLKREMDHTYSAVLKELEASSSRLSKRLKLQAQSTVQRADEADREWRKHSDSLNEDLEDIQASCTELIAEAQSSGSRMCKTLIPEILQSVEKSLDGLRSRYGL